MISIENSNKIRNLGFVCSVLVVVIHTSWTLVPFSISWFVENFVRNGVARIAVPFYFVVSGYFIAIHFGEISWWKTVCRKRVVSLVVPYVIWSLLCSCWSIPLVVAANVLASRPFLSNVELPNISFCRLFGLDLFHKPYLWPLWYIRTLMLYVLLAPMFKFVIVRFKVMWLVFTSGLLVISDCIQVLQHPVIEYFVSISGILYFSIGVWLAICGKQFTGTQKSAAYFGLIGIALLCLRVYCAWYGMTIERLLLTASIPFMLYAVWFWIPTSRWLPWLTACAFPIYVMHPCWQQWVMILGRGIPPESELKAMIMLCVGVGAPILTTLVLRWCTPRVANVVFGGR